MAGIVFFWIALSFLVGWLFAKKGRSFFGGTLLSLVFSPLIGGLVGVLISSDAARLEQQALKQGIGRKCPLCAEIVRPEAKLCRYCGNELPFEDKKLVQQRPQFMGPSVVDVSPVDAQKQPIVSAPTPEPAPKKPAAPPVTPRPPLVTQKSVKSWLKGPMRP